MGSLKKELSSLFASMGDAAADTRKQQRIAAVYEHYKGAIESVYGDDAALFLKHTNAVYVMREDDDGRVRRRGNTAVGCWSARKSGPRGRDLSCRSGLDGREQLGSNGRRGETADRPAEPPAQKRLVVYVDDGIYATELNAQRELLRLKLLELFGERIDTFDIYISRGDYRRKHPFDKMVANEVTVAARETTPVPLSAAEESVVDAACAQVGDQRVQRALRKAMKADLEWKKGETGKK